MLSRSSGYGEALDWIQDWPQIKARIAVCPKLVLALGFDGILFSTANPPQRGKTSGGHIPVAVEEQIPQHFDRSSVAKVPAPIARDLDAICSEHLSGLRSHSL